MSLSEVKLNTSCVVKAVNIKNETIKIRLMELGVVEGCKIMVSKKSVFKKTLLVIFANCCFTLKDNLAKEIEVEYA